MLNDSTPTYNPSVAGVPLPTPNIKKYHHPMIIFLKELVHKSDPLTRPSLCNYGPAHQFR